MKSLTWNQVNAWRLAQHGLAPRLKRESFVEVECWKAVALRSTIEAEAARLGEFLHTAVVLEYGPIK